MRFLLWTIAPTYKWNSLCRAAGERLKNRGKDDNVNRYNETGMLLWRLSGKKKMFENEILPMPFEFVEAVDVETKFIVFVVYQGNGIMLEDDHELYPSDELVAKLKLLLK